LLELISFNLKLHGRGMSTTELYSDYLRLTSSLASSLRHCEAAEARCRVRLAEVTARRELEEGTTQILRVRSLNVLV